MIFGSISYINLFPFSIFLKKALQRTQEKQIIQYHQGVPSKINRLFKQRSIDAAFISSIESRHCS
ncbi:MAG TPA: menaquinone via futalosine step 1, partial [Nitratifractor sp.]|nr:menaquinone via futalosine step 1 [Nitratifractor sp.]